MARFINRGVGVLDFVTGTFHTISKGAGQWVSSYNAYSTMKTERDALLAKLKGSQDLRQKLFQLTTENQNLRRLLDLPQIKEFPVVQAEVISQDPDNWFRTIIINKGSNQGILICDG